MGGYMKKKQIKTNEDILRDIMNFSRYGALAQLFVIDALTKFANTVAASKPEDYPDNGIVQPEAWIGVAKEIKEKLDEFYGK
jgi:hypothetical protein